MVSAIVGSLMLLFSNSHAAPPVPMATSSTTERCMEAVGITKVQIHSYQVPAKVMEMYRRCKTTQ